MWSPGLAVGRELGESFLEGFHWQVCKEAALLQPLFVPLIPDQPHSTLPLKKATPIPAFGCTGGSRSESTRTAEAGSVSSCCVQDGSAGCQTLQLGPWDKALCSRAFLCLAQADVQAGEDCLAACPCSSQGSRVWTCISTQVHTPGSKAGATASAQPRL